MRFVISAAEQSRRDLAALAQKPPAIVQPAQKKDWQYYENNILAAEECTGRLYREYKEGGTWKERYKTWADACEPLGKPRRTVDWIIQQDRTIRQELPNEVNKVEEASLKDVEAAREAEICKVGNGLPTLPDLAHKQKLASLTQVEAAREQKPDEPERPAVHSADEKPRDNGRAKPPAAKPMLDVSGCVIPQSLLALRERRQEVLAAMRCASQLKCLFEAVQNGHDPLFLYLKHTGSNQTFMNGASTMHSQLRECCPDVVCPECGGRSVSCHYCFGSGWISEVRWNRDWVKSNDTVKQSEVQKRSAKLAQ